MDLFRFPDGELSSWACLGAVTDRSVRVWARSLTGGPLVARLEVEGEPAAEATLVPSAEHDWVAAADLTVEQPRPGAAFVVRVAEFERHGRLAPTPGAPTHLTFGFGSCHQPFTPGPDDTLAVHDGAGIYPAMAEVLRQRDASFLLLTGDQIYSDGLLPDGLQHTLRRLPTPPTDAQLRALYRGIYRGYFNQPGFRGLLEGWPSVLSWDDHEIFDGWGSLFNMDDLDRRLYAAAETAYGEYQHLHNAGSAPGDPPPFHHHFWFGDLGFFVFDVRSARDYQAGVVLGERQWRDFERFLTEADDLGAATLFIVAGVPLVHFSPALVHLLEWFPGEAGSDVRDRWCATPLLPERDALLERLFAWQAARPERQVIMLSGDVHVGAAFRLRRPDRPGALAQWTSSSMSTPLRLIHKVTNVIGSSLVNVGEPAYRVRREALLIANNFGLVEASPLPGGGHRVELSLHSYHPSRGLHCAARVVNGPQGSFQRRLPGAARPSPRGTKLELGPKI